MGGPVIHLTGDARPCQRIMKTFANCGGSSWLAPGRTSRHVSVPPSGYRHQSGPVSPLRSRWRAAPGHFASIPVAFLERAAL